MEMNEPYPQEITQAINAFVDRIEQALLQNGTTRAERTSVCAEVETQIYAMIDRRLETGAELKLELVIGIIESMDQPESYMKSIDPNVSTSSENSPSSLPPAMKSLPTKKRPNLNYFRAFLFKPARTEPCLDWVAVVGLAFSCMGLLFVLLGILERREFPTVLGLLGIFAGVLASGTSFWRITHSKGLLTGQRVASIGVLVLPIAFANTLLSGILVGTRLGFALGFLVMASGLVYANYRIIRYSLNWLASYSVVANEKGATPEDTIRPTETKEDQAPGAIVSA